MRSLIRLLAAGAALATVCLVRPSAADMTDNMPRGVSGEGELMFGEPDPRTGAMTQGIPIQLPAARGLPQPRLSLRYVSSSRDREAGYGWGLELPTIERRPLSGFPTVSTGREVIRFQQDHRDPVHFAEKRREVAFAGDDRLSA